MFDFLIDIWNIITDSIGCIVILYSRENNRENNNKMECITWEEIKSFHKNPPRDRLHRNNKINKKYQKHIKKIKDRNINVNEYISNKYFTNKEYDSDWVFVPNNFPYNLENGINHYLIWINPYKLKLSEIDIDRVIIENLGNKEYYYFENLNCNKSVNKVQHVHVFFK